MFNHSHIRHFSSVFVSLHVFELITQNSSENIASRQYRCIYVNGSYPIHILRSLTCLVTIILACGSVTDSKSKYAFRSMDTSE